MVSVVVPGSVLTDFGVPANVIVQSFGSGHINKTFKLDGAGKSFILQRINHHVFKRPNIIASNIREASHYLTTHYPDYRFLSSIQTPGGEDMVYDNDGYPWRLFPYISNTITINEVSSRQEAFEAAKGFAALTRNLSGCNVRKFKPTIDRFHDLIWRYQQFEEAVRKASDDRLKKATDSIASAKRFSYLTKEYERLIANELLKLRITHNDTKINNILLDVKTGNAVCVIDLDTLMPGYFIYDLGDMVRTFVSPRSEEETDLSTITFRNEIYDALIDGYLSEMGDELSEEEKDAISFSGLMMTYIIALRFLTDYLLGDVYFSVNSPDQNLNRARNQFRLLEILQVELK